MNPKIEELVAQYYAEYPEYRGQGGWVKIDYESYAIGWAKNIPDPCTVCPGVIIVNENGEAYIARGGNDNIGATQWDAYEIEQKRSRGRGR